MAYIFHCQHTVGHLRKLRPCLKDARLLLNAAEEWKRMHATEVRTCIQRQSGVHQSAAGEEPNPTVCAAAAQRRGRQWVRETVDPVMLLNFIASPTSQSSGLYLPTACRRHCDCVDPVIPEYDPWA